MAKDLFNDAALNVNQCLRTQQMNIEGLNNGMHGLNIPQGVAQNGKGKVEPRKCGVNIGSKTDGWV